MNIYLKIIMFLLLAAAFLFVIGSDLKQDLKLRNSHESQDVDSFSIYRNQFDSIRVIQDSLEYEVAQLHITSNRH